MKNKIITILLSVVLAVGLWTYVITVERPDSETTFYYVPVVLEGEEILKERGMMITSQTQKTVTLKLAGSRKDLNQLKSSDIAAVIDLSRVTEAGEKNATYSVVIPGDAGLEVVARQPESISLSITEWATKEIPVTLELIGRVPEGYYVDKQNATMDRRTVNVSGPKDIIAEIEQAVVKVDLEGRSEIIVEDLRYTLCDEKGSPIEDVSSVTTDAGQIRVTVSVQKLKDLTVTYDVVDGGGLKASDVEISTQHSVITVAGSAAALENMTELYLGSVDLGTLTESTQMSFLVKLPDGVSNQSGITAVELDIQLPEMEIREYTVSQLELNNIPEGWKAQALSQARTVKIRGRTPVLDRLSEDLITLQVDLSNAQLGSATYEAKVVIDGFGEADNVGAVEKYTVPVRVEEIIAQEAGTESQP